MQTVLKGFGHHRAIGPKVMNRKTVLFTLITDGLH